MSFIFKHVQWFKDPVASTSPSSHNPCPFICYPLTFLPFRPLSSLIWIVKPHPNWSPFLQFLLFCICLHTAARESFLKHLSYHAPPLLWSLQRFPIALQIKFKLCLGLKSPVIWRPLPPSPSVSPATPSAHILSYTSSITMNLLPPIPASLLLQFWLHLLQDDFPAHCHPPHVLQVRCLCCASPALCCPPRGTGSLCTVTLSSQILPTPTPKLWAPEGSECRFISSRPSKMTST